MIIFCKGVRKNKGSITVEASIVVPIVILCIVALVYIGLLLYQRSIMQSAADKAAEIGGLYWGTSGADISTGKIDKERLGDSGLYWRIYDLSVKEKIDKIESYAKAILKKRNLLNTNNAKITANITDYIVYKRLEITIENSYILPAGALLHIFGINDRFTINVKSYSVIDDAAEFIRNTDFIIDLEKKLENQYPGIKNLGDQTREVMNLLKKNIETFIK